MLTIGTLILKVGRETRDDDRNINALRQVGCLFDGKVLVDDFKATHATGEGESCTDTASQILVHLYNLDIDSFALGKRCVAELLHRKSVEAWRGTSFRWLFRPQINGLLAVEPHFALS